MHTLLRKMALHEHRRWVTWLHAHVPLRYSRHRCFFRLHCSIGQWNTSVGCPSCTSFTSLRRWITDFFKALVRKLLYAHSILKIVFAKISHLTIALSPVCRWWRQVYLFKVSLIFFYPQRSVFKSFWKQSITSSNWSRIVKVFRILIFLTVKN